jgi:hypothetical protein
MGSSQKPWGHPGQPVSHLPRNQGLLRAHRDPTSLHPGDDPHRNPTDETALYGKLVMLVNSMDNFVDQPLCARAGLLGLFQVSAFRVTGPLLTGRSMARLERRLVLTADAQRPGAYRSCRDNLVMTIASGR